MATNPAINSISACIADLPVPTATELMRPKPRSDNPAADEQSVTIDQLHAGWNGKGRRVL